MKKKSLSTKVLSLFFLSFALFVASYLFAHALYHPAAAFHRWATVIFSLLSMTIFTQFIFVYPEDTHKKIRRLVLYLQLGVLVLTEAYFVLVTLGKDVVFFNEGQYFDFDAQGASRVVGIVIATFIFSVLASAIFRIFIEKVEQRRVLLAITLLFVLATVGPGFTNLKSRSGELSRDLHQTLFTFIMVLVAFSIFVTYVNHTKDKSTFLAKILGITIVTFFILMLGISYLYLNDKEETYNRLQLAEIEKTIVLKDYPQKKNLEYLVSYRFNQDDVYKVRYRRRGEIPMLADYLQNTMLLFRLENLDEQEFTAKATKLLHETHETFTGYAQALAMWPLKNKESFLQRLQSLRHDLYIHRNKVTMIEKENFRNGIQKYLSLFKDDTSAFAPVLQKAIKNPENASDEVLKDRILEFLTPMYPVGRRAIRETGNHTRFLGFTVLVQGKNAPVLYAAGINYASYREVINQAAFKILLILILVFLGILFIFPVFFRGNLLNPLNELLEGVRRVNEGDLQSTIPIRINDEIGFLSSSFNLMVSTVKEGKEKLEERVKERTFELKTTLDEVQLLKEKQDGDYFLTTLLIKPLSVNNSQSASISIDALTRQKKRFKFRKHRSQIGGDINIAHTIHLRKKSYTVVLNADAMGKSIQGAGGALVLGSVFQSILERTSRSSSEQKAYPERWLKNAFVELNDVFCSFNGSMLLSLILGLIDDESGLFYFINAEHPWAILYRDGIADFLERDLELRKLGTEKIDDQVRVKTFQMKLGDSIILGSDGRDDILTSVDKNGEMMINHDESQILRHIERASGQLPGTYKSLRKAGELIDDLSLLKILILLQVLNCFCQELTVLLKTKTMQLPRET